MARACPKARSGCEPVGGRSLGRRNPQAPHPILHSPSSERRRLGGPHLRHNQADILIGLVGGPLFHTVSIVWEQSRKGKIRELSWDSLSEVVFSATWLRDLGKKSFEVIPASRDLKKGESSPKRDQVAGRVEVATSGGNPYLIDL